MNDIVPYLELRLGHGAVALERHALEGVPHAVLHAVEQIRHPEIFDAVEITESFLRTILVASTCSRPDVLSRLFNFFLEHTEQTSTKQTLIHLFKVFFHPEASTYPGFSVFPPL